MSENFSVGESQFSSAGAVSDLSLTSVSDAAYSMPATFETSMVSAGAVSPAGGTLDANALLTECRVRMPAYMVPSGIEVREGPLPRNPNGKIDRKTLSTAWIEAHGS